MGILSRIWNGVSVRCIRRSYVSRCRPSSASRSSYFIDLSINRSDTGLIDLNRTLLASRYSKQETEQPAQGQARARPCDTSRLPAAVDPHNQHSDKHGDQES